jgi:hypothetical protein
MFSHINRADNWFDVYKSTVVSRRHFFFVAPDWRHVTGTMMAALGGLRGFVGERR